MSTVRTSLGIFVTIALGKQHLRNEKLYERLPKVTLKKLCSSLRSWRLFCCVFSFVVRNNYGEIRDSAAQKLNRGGKTKRWEGGGGGVGGEGRRQ